MRTRSRSEVRGGRLRLAVSVVWARARVRLDAVSSLDGGGERNCRAGIGVTAGSNRALCRWTCDRRRPSDSTGPLLRHTASRRPGAAVPSSCPRDLWARPQALKSTSCSRGSHRSFSNAASSMSVRRGWLMHYSALASAGGGWVLRSVSRARPRTSATRRRSARSSTRQLRLTADTSVSTFVDLGFWEVRREGAEVKRKARSEDGR